MRTIFVVFELLTLEKFPQISKYVGSHLMGLKVNISTPCGILVSSYDLLFVARNAPPMGFFFVCVAIGLLSDACGSAL